MWCGVERKLGARLILMTGLFMGLLAGALLVAILSVGISAVSSLQVSYGAFDKEMGPAAQKKAQ